MIPTTYTYDVELMILIYLRSLTEVNTPNLYITGEITTFCRQQPTIEGILLATFADL